MDFVFREGPGRQRTAVTLSTFVRGLPGPAAVSFHGSTFRVISVLQYAEGTAIEWELRKAEELGQHGAGSSDEAPLTFDDIRDLFDAARLTDEHGTAYQPGGCGLGGGGTSFHGRLAFSPDSIAAARLNLSVGGFEVVLPLADR